MENMWPVVQDKKCLGLERYQERHPISNTQYWPPAIPIPNTNTDTIIQHSNDQVKSQNSMMMTMTT